MSLRKIYYHLPPSVRLFLRKMIFLPFDLFAKITGKDKDLPSRGAIYTGSGDFKATGKKFADLLIQYCNLKPDSKILDIGSGIGRVAIPLSAYLLKDGEYEGFDVVETGVKWCNNNISSKYPNFNFTHVDLGNDLYNTSKTNAAKFIFPYPDNHFNSSISLSVYTHFLADELEQYVLETKRVIQTGSKCLASLFIFENEDELTANPKFSFTHGGGSQFLMDAKVKRANVAFSRKFIQELFEEKMNLRIDRIFWGHWKTPQNPNAIDFQDIIIFSKK